MLENVFQRGFALILQGGMLENRSARLGVRLEHPHIAFAVDADIEAELAELVRLVAFARFGPP